MKEIIFVGSTDPVLHQMYKDLEVNTSILYQRGIKNFNNKFLKFIFKICFSKKINNYISIPFKQKWFEYIFPKNIIISDSALFIFTKDNFKYLELGFAKYLKKNYPRCKIILLFLDIHGLRGYDFSALEGLFDDAIVFDESEAKKYGITYYPLCYSRSKYENLNKIYDICFIGQDKGRINKIYEIFNKAKATNLKMKVIICGEFNNKNKYPEFEFIDSISYDEALKYISQSKFNLEICLEDTTSISIRLYEAIMFNQGLITNNSNIINSPYYDKSYIYNINDFDNLDLSFVNEFKGISENLGLKDKISPLRFIEYEKNKLEVL